MGQVCSRKHRAKIVMLGLDFVGKTSIVFKLKLNEVVTTVPTIGYNYERLDYRDIRFDVWDVGGKEEVRPLWKHYLAEAKGIVFVVDSTDRTRITLAAELLETILSNDDLRSAVILVLANKQDLPDAMDPSEVAEKLGLTGIVGRRWFIQPTSVFSDDGLRNGLDWLSDTLITYHFSRGWCPNKLPCICL